MSVFLPQEIFIRYCDEQQISTIVQEDDLTTKKKRAKTTSSKSKGKKFVVDLDVGTLENLGFKTLQVMKDDAMLNEIYGSHLDELKILTNLDLSCLIPSLEQVFKGKPVYANFEECMKQFQLVANNKNMVQSLAKQLHGSTPDFISWFILHFMHVFAETFSRKQVTKTKEIATLTENEKDVVVYVSGFVINKLTKQFYNLLRKIKSTTARDKICAYINRLGMLIKTEEMNIQNTKLIDSLTRGGLKYPKQAVCEIFITVESVFRSIVSEETSVIDSKSILEECISRRDIMPKYFAAIQEDGNLIEKHTIRVLESCISLYIKIRCHNHARQLAEKYRKETKSSRKKKGIRKELESKHNEKDT